MADMFYSVGTSTADLKTGTPNVSITSGVATFDVAQTGSIIVGDIVLANSISYAIVGKTSTTVWNVRNINGTAASNIGSTSVTSIKRAFNGLVAAISGATPGAANASHLNTMNLVTATINLFIACAKDGEDATGAGVITQGWTTSTTYKLTIFTPYDTATQCNTRQRHTGTAGTGYVQKCNSAWSDTGIQVLTSNTIIDGLDMYASSGNGQFGIKIGGDNQAKDGFVIRNNIARNFNWGKNFCTGYNCGTGQVYNNIFYNAMSTNGDADAEGVVNFYTYEDSSPYIKFYNNIVFSARGQRPCLYVSDLSASHKTDNLFKNNVFYNSNDNSYATPWTIYWKNAPSNAFSSSYLAGAQTGATNSGYNTTSNAVDFKGAAGTGTQTSKSNTDIKFTNITAGSENFLPTAGSCLIAAGIGPTSDANTPTTDIKEVTRSGATCTIGPFEVAAAATASDNNFQTIGRGINRGLVRGLA